MDELRDHLLRDAFLYDEPESFIAGVEATLRAVQRLPRPGGDVTHVADRAAAIGAPAAEVRPA